MMKFVMAIGSCCVLLFTGACSSDSTLPQVRFEPITDRGVTISCGGENRAIEVREGDTLLRLTVRYVDVRATIERKGWVDPVTATQIIAQANGLDNPDKIRSGQSLILPEFCDLTIG